MAKRKAKKIKMIEKKQAQEVLNYVKEHNLNSINSKDLQKIKNIINNKNLNF